MVKDQINNLKNEAVGEVLEAKDEKSLEEIRARFLGRSGKINELTKEIPKLAASERGNIGKLINETKITIENALRESLNNLKERTSENEAWLDVTAPGIKSQEGHLHLVTETISEITSIFSRLGFHRARYPEVEWDYYAFEGLNFPENHPARDDW